MAETTRDEDRTEEYNRKGGRNVILLEEADISEGIKACSNSLFGRLFASKTFSVRTMENALKALWKNPEGFSVSDKGDNSFQFFFNKEVDVLRVKRSSPWLFKDYVLHVKRWKEDQNCDEENISNFPVWVQFCGLPELFKALRSWT
ncbi:uncharacterized protein LOC107620329 [Arachis ipaensis]|uniref:uncharacterized protein LOC107620329 n=1 Tax=Arachis ipaensis TaxID=130454 RepID=UPI0007AFA9BC|nr:uncharacterized protein LOC107620329 [Arachis ipaensis]XP_025684921.1 uncharacterized protein LOC112785695 [Arachis hypogaea]